MRPQFAIKTLFPFILIAIFFTSCQGQVREPAVAGSFYPAKADELKETVQSYLNKAENKPIDGDLVALISPHAGYIFSGQVAAYGFKQIVGKTYDTVIIIGASHHSAFKGISVYDRGAFKTPLGKVKINEKLAKSLIDKSKNVDFYPDAHAKEHSLEVQIPFLQVALKGDFQIVPVLFGTPTKESFDHLVAGLMDIVSSNKNVLIVASTDLSHYHDYGTALTMDSKLIQQLTRMSVRDAEKLLASGESEMCGAYAVLATMEAARGLGANFGSVFKTANSGDVMTDKKNVVGYTSIGFYKNPLTDDEKQELLKIAKDSIIDYVKDRKIAELDIKNPKFLTEGAVFVTINRQGNLRGCIGHLHPVMPLYESVQKNAVAASTNDFRFPPMVPEELKDMEVEITILSPLVPVKNLEDIVVGKHGLYMFKDGHGGVLLPQVPVDFGWDRTELLRQLSLKAGLQPDSYKSGAMLLSFTAEIIK